jgi:hypothetical protein
MMEQVESFIVLNLSNQSEGLHVLMQMLHKSKAIFLFKFRKEVSPIEINSLGSQGSHPVVCRFDFNIICLIILL